MLIDGCPHSFTELAQGVLPDHMSKLRAELSAPHHARLFSLPGSGPVAIARALGLRGDFSGCYVLVEKDEPIYVGISRSVLSRLRQHFTGKTHFDASLVYAIAQRRLPTIGKRAEAMASALFQKEFAAAQAYLRTLQVAFVEIQNPLELYVFEAYAAMELRTHVWNTFRTH
jgi:GIY-YIG catalytic domain